MCDREIRSSIAGLRRNPESEGNILADLRRKRGVVGRKSCVESRASKVRAEDLGGNNDTTAAEGLDRL